MFDKIYVDENLYDKDLDEALVKKLHNKVKVQYCAAEDIDSITHRQEKKVFVGNNSAFLEEASRKNAVIAVVGGCSDDLFKYKYAVMEISAIDYDYLEMIYARFNNIPLLITQSENLLIKEMTLEEASKLFDLACKYPELFENSDIVSCADRGEGNGDIVSCADRGEGNSDIVSRADRDDENSDIVSYANKAEGNETEDMAYAYIRSVYDLYGYGMWSLFRKNDGRFVGFAGLYDSLTHDKICTCVSYYVVPSLRRRGYALEALEAVLKYAEDVLGINDVGCVISEDNTASKKVALKMLSKKVANLHIYC